LDSKIQSLLFGTQGLTHQRYKISPEFSTQIALNFDLEIRLRLINQSNPLQVVKRASHQTLLAEIEIQKIKLQ